VDHHLIDARAGHQGEKGHQQIARHRALSYPRHDFRVEGEEHRRPEVGQKLIAREVEHQQIDQPRQPPAGGADDRPKPPDIEGDAKPHAGGKGEEGGEEIVGEDTHSPPPHNPTSPSARPVPRAMPAPVRRASASLDRPDTMSPAIMSRIKLVMTSPGTRAIMAPVMMGSR